MIEVRKMIEASRTRHPFVSALATHYATLGPHFNCNIHTSPVWIPRIRDASPRDKFCVLVISEGKSSGTPEPSCILVAWLKNDIPNSNLLCVQQDRKRSNMGGERVSCYC